MPKKNPAPVKTRFTWREVVRAIPDPETRSSVSAKYKEAGFSMDEFEHSKTAQKALLKLLIRLEDAEERIRKEHPARKFRRQLEIALYP